MSVLDGKHTRLALLLASLSLAAPLRAATFDARETAVPLGKGHGEVGIFGPLRWGLTDDLTLEVHPILFLAGDFHGTVRVRHLQIKGWSLEGEYGLSVPTLGMRLTQHLGLASPFFPTWKKSDKRVGFFVVPHLGVLASRALLEDTWLTLRTDLTVGIPIGRNDALPIDSVFAPLELVMAPMLTGYRFRIGGGIDHPVVAWLRVRGQVDLFWTGKHPEGYAQLSTFFFKAYAGADLRLSKRMRLTLGLTLYNWDQHATKVVVDADGIATREHVRSTDVWPSLDLLWRW